MTQPSSTFTTGEPLGSSHHTDSEACDDGIPFVLDDGDIGRPATVDRRLSDEELGHLERAAQILSVSVSQLFTATLEHDLLLWGDIPSWLAAFPRWRTIQGNTPEAMRAQARWIEEAAGLYRLHCTVYPDLDVLQCWRTAYRWEEARPNHRSPPEDRARLLTLWCERSMRQLEVDRRSRPPRPTAPRRRSAPDDTRGEGTPSIRDSGAPPPAGFDREPRSEPVAPPSPEALPVHPTAAAADDEKFSPIETYAPGAEITLRVPSPDRLYRYSEQTYRFGPFGGYTDGGWVFEYDEPASPSARKHLVFDGKRIVKPMERTW